MLFYLPKHSFYQKKKCFISWHDLYPELSSDYDRLTLGNAIIGSLGLAGGKVWHNRLWNVTAHISLITSGHLFEVIRFRISTRTEMDGLHHKRGCTILYFVMDQSSVFQSALKTNEGLEKRRGFLPCLPGGCKKYGVRERGFGQSAESD